MSAAATLAIAVGVGAASAGVASAQPVASAASHARAVSAAVSQALTKFEAPTKKYALPTTGLKSVSKLKGKTIFYVPVASVVPEFVVTAANMKQAASAVGAKLSVCSDPTGTPSEWSSCVNQAIAAHASAIVLDALPWQVVANQLKTAEKKGIKVVLADQQPNKPFTVAGKSTFILGVSGSMQTAATDWMIQDSGGTGNALMIEDTDGPSPPWYINSFALPELKKYAPGLKYTVQTISTANQGQLSSDVSSQMLKNPSIDYVYTEFDQFLQNAQQGVQSANATAKVKGVSTTALLAGLQLLKSGQYLYADAGDDYPYEAWAIADAAYRLILGQPSVTENIPMRLFTRQNVSTVQLTNAAQSNGLWYGATNFPTLWKKLWGVK